jgi:hypothetical protein
VSTHVSLEEWSQQVDDLCVARLGRQWNDLCGDPQPLDAAFQAGEQAVDFVHRWALEHDLVWA